MEITTVNRMNYDSKIDMQEKSPIQTKVNNEKQIQDSNKQDTTLTDEAVKNAIDVLNRKLKESKTECEFSFHEGTKQIMIKIINPETKEVIKEIPPEKNLDRIVKMWELAGILVDERR